jgi:alpha-galactosidase
VQQGLRLTPKGDTEVWFRRLNNGDTAVGLYNKNGANPANISVAVADLGYIGNVTVRDIWAQSNVEVTSTQFTASVPLHGTGFYRFSAL